MVEPRRRFRFLKELSEGAFGKVYMAEMITGEGFSSIVAIKLLHGKWAGHLEIAQRSRDEARLLGLLHHRNIVRVEDLSSINGQCAIVMEYLDGVDLKALTAYCQKNGQRFPKRAAFEITAQIAGALEAAYNQMPLKGGAALHVIHRDIKPSNVMVTSAGDVKVLDFGTARANFEEREAKTQALAFGSQAYMAPERLLGDPDGPAGDVFSLGVTLFELLTFQAFGKIFIRQERYDRALEERMEMLDLSDINPEGAELVRDVMGRLLSYDAASRPSSGEVVDLMDNLADVVNDGSMQRFCRQIVKPCRDAMEAPQNPDDPLTGSTLFEDTATGLSLIPQEYTADDVGAPAPTPDAPAEPGPAGGSEASSWSPPAAGRASRVSTSPSLSGVSAPSSPSWSPPNASLPPESKFVEPAAPASATLTPPAAVTGAAVTGAAVTGAAVTGAAVIGAEVIGAPPTWTPRAPTEPSPDERPPTLPPTPPTRIQTVQPVAVAPTRPAVAAPDRPAGAPSSGNMGRINGISAVLGVLLVVGVATLLFQGRSGSTEASTDGAAGSSAGSSTGAATETKPAEATEPDGGRIEVGPMDGTTGTLSLTMGTPAAVSITSVTGFKQDWNGKGTLELVGLPAGNYRTKITVGSEAKRLALDVVAGKTCAFAFDDASKDEWEAKGCQ